MLFCDDFWKRFFHPSFQSFAPAAQCQLASSVNYCYLVVWDPIAGTNSLSRHSQRFPSPHTSLSSHWAQSVHAYWVTQTAQRFALSDFPDVRAPVRCITVLIGVPLCKRAQGFHHISRLIASFNLPQMRPKSLWKILYSSLLIINKNLKWRNIY